MIAAKVIADSLCPRNHRLPTLVVTMPRMILAEFNTHRLFSRNSASSRAIPFERMLKMVQENPFIPMAWQRDHKGMQGVEYITDSEEIDVSTKMWLIAKNKAVDSAIMLHENHYSGGKITKQLCNRLLEPFMYHTVIVSATEWLNFFEQRCPQYEYQTSDKDVYFKSKKEWLKSFKSTKPDNKVYESLINENIYYWLGINKGQAEIHMMAVAEAIYDALNESTPKQLQEGEWHIPFGDNIDLIKLTNVLIKLDKCPGWDDTYESECAYDSDPDSFYQMYLQDAVIKIAIARCARVSYLNYEGKDDYEADLKLYDSLVKNLHMSPLEHCARVMTHNEYYNQFIKTQKQDRFRVNIQQGWCNNFRGFIQQRWEIENEAA